LVCNQNQYDTWFVAQSPVPAVESRPKAGWKSSEDDGNVLFQVNATTFACFYPIVNTTLRTMSADNHGPFGEGAVGSARNRVAGRVSAKERQMEQPALVDTNSPLV
jgi:hypothetical protein